MADTALSILGLVGFALYAAAGMALICRITRGDAGDE
jgi:hypothetical protein